MKVQFHRGRRRAGFSLAELLVVVGIIGILLGVAVPSIIYYQRVLKLTELDDNARAVFIAAQNHLTALRSASAGELEVSPAVGRGAKDVPHDATEAGTALLYVSTDAADAKPGWLVLPGSIESDIAEGHYLVEFEPKSGSVYGVFYTENNQLDESAYQTVYEYRDGTNSCRVREGRKAFSNAAGGFYVGYYGADGALDVDRPDAQTLPQPQLKLTNAEELVLELGTDAASWPAAIDQSKVYASVVVSDGSAAKTLVDKGAIRSGAGGTVVLDTLKTSGYDQNGNQNTAGWTVGNSFAGWMADGGSYTITPGADVTVTVSIWYQPGAGEGVVALPQTGSVTTNSLFAARSGSAVQVAYGRHLQNLHPDVSHLDSAVTDVRQVRGISFAQAGGGLYSWEDTYGHDARPFVPIENVNLKTYHGGGLAIRDLNAVKVSGRYENAGLFGVFSGSLLENVTLVDAKVTGGDTTGTLAGTVQNATVSGCRAYFAKRPIPQIRGTSDAGGLIGNAANCTIQDGSYASVLVNGVTVGGLVGRCDGNVTVRESYAAGQLYGVYVGGLVGRHSAGVSLRIENCYAAGTIDEAVAKGSLTPEAGGLSTSSATVLRSYAAVEYGNVPAAEKVYGVVPGGSCVNVYYLAKSGVNDVVSVNNVTAVTSSEQMKKAQGLNLGAAFIEGGNAGVMTVPYNLDIGGTPRDPQLSAPYPYPTLKVTQGTGELELPHYGDWLEVDVSSVYLAYFEQYADGSYGYQYPTSSGEETTLRDDKGALRNEGYALISKEDPKVVQIAGADAGWTKHTDTFTDSAGDTFNIYILATDLAQTRHTQAPARYESDMPADYGGHCELTVDGEKIWFNPDFAKTTSLKKPGSVKEYAIRSIRHFNNMRRYSSDHIDLWTQELDLDGALYEGYQVGDKIAGMAVVTAIIGEDATPSRVGLVMDTITMVSANAVRDTWGAVYDGGDHAIRHMDIKPIANVGSKSDDQKRTYAGLFGRTINASVKNLTVENCSVTGDKVGSSDNVYAGILVGYNEGTVENCYAVNCSVTASTGYAGGLVGYVRSGAVKNCGVRLEGTAQRNYADQSVSGTGKYAGGFTGYHKDGVIEHCYAAVKVSGQSAGGFVGLFDGSGSIRNCYAGGHTQNGKYSAERSNVVGTKQVGGFIGQYKTGTVDTCYTTCAVSGPSAGKTDVFAALSDSATPSVSNCYAMGATYVNGTAQVGSNATGVAVTMTKLPAAQRTETHPYDAALTSKYPFTPTTYADGTSMPHYGDWPDEISTGGGGRKWVQQVQDYTPIEENYPNLDVSEPEWYGDTLTLTFDVSSPWGYQNDIANSGPLDEWGNCFFNGTFSLTSDLGYRQIFRIVKSGDGYEILGLPGAAIVRHEEYGFSENEWGQMQPDANHGFKWVIEIPSDQIPPYVEYVSLDALEYVDGQGDKCIVTNIINADPSYSGANKVDRLGDEDGITVGEEVTDLLDTFKDWLGYQHQLMERMRAEAQTPIDGHREGAALGLDNKVYFHMINTNKSTIHSWTPQINASAIGGIGGLVLEGPNGLKVEMAGYQLLNGNQPYPSTKPGLVEYALGFDVYNARTQTWGRIEPVRIVFYASEDREEFEMEVDLDMVAEAIGYDSGDVFTKSTLKFYDGNLRDLIVERDPPEN